MRFIDLNGKKFGRWTVIKRVKNTKKYNGACWLCKCDCGTEKIVSSCTLISGKSQSCGCLRDEICLKKFGMDITGRKFDRLTVIKRVESPKDKKYKKTFWLCKCDCGNEKIIGARPLITGNTKSCGCLAHETKCKEYGWSAKVSKYNSYKGKARRAKQAFNLSLDEFIEITSRNCEYCGAEPSNISKSKSNNGDYIYNGIDRVDSSKGYVKNNVVAACWRCNSSKNDSSVQDFLKWAENLYNHSIAKNDIKEDF